MRKGKRRMKSGKRRSTFQKKASSSPKVVYRTRTKTRVRYYSKPRRRVRAKGRRVARTRTVRARTGRIIGAAIAGVVAGAALGSLANENGLLAYAPTQNRTGIAVGGLVGLTLVIIGFFVKSEGMKLLLYGLGGGLIVEEVTRQLETRGYDFRVAFGNAPPLDYSHGVAGACAQLRSYEAANVAAQLPGGAGAPEQLPAGQPQSQPRPQPAPQKPAAAPARGAADPDAQLTEDDLSVIRALMLQGNGTFPQVRDDVLADKARKKQTSGVDVHAHYRYALRKVA